jgi:AcrR family transcriptional regulator
MVDAPAAAAKRKTGRPARLDRDMIAKAAGEIGLGQVTMRAVADRLGVSIPGLYHYVNGRADLLRLAAEQLAQRIAVPQDDSQHWAVWLYQWGEHVHAGFTAEPDFLEQFMHGTMGVDLMVDNIEIVVGFLVSRGFSPREAYAAYNSVTSCAIGAAVGDIRERDSQRAGRSTPAEQARLVAERGASELPNLAEIVADGAPMRPPFRQQVATMLAGIAVRRGDDWRCVVDLILGLPEPVVRASGPTH